jgi:putative transposase
MKQIKTLKVRVRDKHALRLQQMACSVNLVWNYLNELSARSIRERGRFLSAFDMHPYTKGANKELGLHSQTLQEVAREYVTRRQQFKTKRTPPKPARIVAHCPIRGRKVSQGLE